MKFLNNITPPYDKLKHYFVGSLLFLLFLVFLKPLYAFYVVLGLSVLWEVYHKIKGGKNSLKEMVLDIIYSASYGGVFIIINSSI